jgi:hypothetical protein
MWGRSCELASMASVVPDEFGAADGGGLSFVGVSSGKATQYMEWYGSLLASHGWRWPCDWAWLASATGVVL